jgi:hypothetical protein
MGVSLTFAGAGLNHSPLDLCLLGSWDNKYELLCFAKLLQKVVIKYCGRKAGRGKGDNECNNETNQKNRFEECHLG